MAEIVGEPLTTLPETTAPGLLDIMYVVLDPSGSKVSEYVTVGNLLKLGGVTRLNASANAGVTTLTINDLPFGMATSAAWVIIDPWTNEAEIRKVTNRSGTTVTISSGLTYNHVSGDQLYWLDNAIVNVLWFAAKGDGVTDDTTSIQRAVSSAQDGWSIYFPGPGPYMVDGITYQNGCRYFGDNMGGTGTIVKLKNSATGDGVFIAENWINNNTQGGERVRFEHLTIDGNRANNTAGYGIILQNQRSYISDCLIQNCDSDGVFFAITTKNGTSITENCVENRVENTRIENITGHGIYAGDGSRYTDGYIENCTIRVIEGDYSIYIGSGSGWKLHGNHFSSTSKGCIRLKNAGYSDVSNNYIEGYGNGATTGTYHGIWIHGPQEIVIANNRINNANAVVGSTYHAIFVQGSTTNDTYFTIVGNQIKGNGTETAIRLEESAGTDIYGDIVGNRVTTALTLESYGFAEQRITYSGNSWQAAEAAPVSGWWPEGMIVWNNNPVVLAPMGWICTSSGTPGTWRNYAEIRDASGYRGEGARVYRGTDQTIGTGSWTSITFGSERFDTNAIHSTGADTSRLTCKAAGVYLIGGGVRFAGNTTGQRGVRLYLNNATVLAEKYGDTNPTAGTTWRENIFTVYELAVDDYVELQVWQSSGGDLACVASANAAPEFWIYRLS